ncbi:MAG: hypothetical protein ACI8P3_003155 [Saprospiraceae bacterium]|jgi:hypothetical protein
MKFIYSILCLSLFFVGCTPQADNSANEAFEKNSQTVLANIEGFQNENQDYSQYAKDFVRLGTSFGSKDSISLEDMIKNDKNTWEKYDFKIVTDPIVLLPGVNADTKMVDGSVRYYADWQVTRTGTDSTEAKSGIIGIYESFDFDADYKIVNQVGYGDFTGIIMHLDSEAAEEVIAAEE